MSSTGATGLELGIERDTGYSFNVKINWRNYSTQKPNPLWRGALIAARIIRKKEAGKPLSPRDRRIARELFEDEGVSNRLIDQAVSCLKATVKF